jgi:hypothetical protein
MKCTGAQGRTEKFEGPGQIFNSGPLCFSKNIGERRGSGGKEKKFSRK